VLVHEIETVLGLLKKGMRAEVELHKKENTASFEAKIFIPFSGDYAGPSKFEIETFCKVMVENAALFKMLFKEVFDKILQTGFYYVAAESFKEEAIPKRFIINVRGLLDDDIPAGADSYEPYCGTENMQREINAREDVKIRLEVKFKEERK